MLRHCLLGLFTVAFASAAVADDINQTYHFSLFHGRGQPVCEAYLNRLNATDYGDASTDESQAPFCALPEVDSGHGFAKLNRVYLAPDAQKRLVVGVYNALHPSAPLSSALAQQFTSYAGRWSQVWTYSSPIDIENNGMPDNILLWKGAGAEGDNYGCGEQGLSATGGLAFRGAQQALVMTSNGTAIDQAKTEAIFWTRKTSAAPAEPLGQEVNVFDYEGKFYFSAFLYGPYRYDAGQSYQPVADTLRVYFQKLGVTSQICEYRMRDPEPIQTVP